MVRQDLSKSTRPLDDPLHWHCPQNGKQGLRCHARPDQPCGNPFALKSTDNTGTHRSRVRLALYYKYNPDAELREAMHYALHYGRR